MGEITDALRANLREMAQSDARVMRELDACLQPGSRGEALLSSSPAVARLDDGLDRLGLKELRALGKERGFKSLTKLKKNELIAMLRNGEPAPAALPAQRSAARGETGSGGASEADPALLEARLERMEALLQRIATRLGVN